MSAVATQPPAPGRPARRFGLGRVLLLVLGSIVSVGGIALLAGGVVAVWGLSQRDAFGYFTTESKRLSTPSYALASASLDIGPDTPGGIGHFATVRIRARSARPVFVGIGRATDVRRYLGRVQHSQITDFDTDPFRITSHGVAGTASPAPPARQRFWRVQASGVGTQTISWSLERGKWSAVTMNADGSRGVSVLLSVGARVPALRWFAIGFLAGGCALLLVGAGLVYIGLRRRGPRSGTPAER